MWSWDKSGARQSRAHHVILWRRHLRVHVTTDGVPPSDATTLQSQQIGNRFWYEFYCLCRRQKNMCRFLWFQDSTQIVFCSSICPCIWNVACSYIGVCDLHKMTCLNTVQNRFVSLKSRPNLAHFEPYACVHVDTFLGCFRCWHCNRAHADADFGFKNQRYGRSHIWNNVLTYQHLQGRQVWGWSLPWIHLPDMKEINTPAQ